MNWLSVIRHLLPNARAWSVTADKTLRRFFEGLAGGPEDAKKFIDEVYGDIWPDSTREVADWLEQFALVTPPGATTGDLRARLDAAWKETGGQSPRYIQDTLRAAGFDVYVHEWWVPIPEHPTGGSVDGDVAPVARNPFDYLDDGSANPWEMVDAGPDAQDGDPVAQDGGTAVPVGYPLVNKIVERQTPPIGDGAPRMQDGDPVAQDGGTQITYPRKRYTIPADPTKYPYFLYIGGETFPETAGVPQARREEFEDLCLKICPTQQWLGILVTYS